MIASRRFFPAACAALLITLLAGCGDKPAAGQAAGAGMPPPEVGVVTIAPQKLALTTELPGRVEALRVAQVRARVPGVVLKRVFAEGSDVKAGDVLFRIDPAPFQAAYESASAALSKAEANLTQANLKEQRYKPLVATNAISKQEYDDAIAVQKQAAADVANAKASQTNARLNLSYATVTAPISGRIGRALVTEGALVGQGEATQLAVIQQMDPVYVTLTQSSAELLRLRDAMAKGQLKKVDNGHAKVTVTTEDGRPYPLPGKLLFSDLSVDESTGAITLRAEFPNPDRTLLPGTFVRARLEQAVDENAIVIPQQAVIRTLNGATVMVVGQDNKVAVRAVKADNSQGDSWIITSGLKPGDRVIVDGVQKAKPDTVVKPVEWKNPLVAQANAPAK